MNKAPKLTRWFSPGTKPSIRGVYQRDYAGKEGLEIVYSHWNGSRWGLFGRTVREAEDMKELSSSYQNFKWRGLALRPKGKA